MNETTVRSHWKCDMDIMGQVTFQSDMPVSMYPQRTQFSYYISIFGLLQKTLVTGHTMKSTECHLV